MLQIDSYLGVCSSFYLVIPIVLNMCAFIDGISLNNNNLLFAKTLGWNKNRIPALQCLAREKPSPSEINDNRDEAG